MNLKLKLFFLILIAFIFIGDIGNNSTIYKSLVDSKGFHRIAIDGTEESPHYENYTLHINVGDQIIWINDDPSDRITIISEQYLWKNDSAMLRLIGKQFNYSFNEAGRYTFYIEQHNETPKQIIIVSNITNNTDNNTSLNITEEPTLNITEPIVNITTGPTTIPTVIENISPTTNIDNKNNINAIAKNPILMPLNILGNLKIMGFVTVAVIMMMSLIRK